MEKVLDANKQIAMWLTPHTPNNQIIKLSNKLIPKTTNRKTVSLVIGVPVYATVIVKHVTYPGNACNVLRRTPPVTDATKVIVITLLVKVTARKN